MTEELKTLKDFEDGAYLDDYSIKEYTEKLRQEAIKWVKECDKTMTYENNFVKCWIIHFFNLTEEDLK